MKKKITMTVTAVLMSLLLALPAYAAEWKSDTNGWWYQYDDASYPNNGWTWVDGKCYYFTPEGYCLMDTQTPDGYTVDASGAWVVDGVVQTQDGSQSASGTTVQWGSLSFTVPDEFVRDTTSTEDGLFFLDENRMAAIIVAGKSIPDMEGMEDQLNALQELILDQSIVEYYGIPSAKNLKEFSTGAWYRYDFADAGTLEIPGSLTIYVRIKGIEIQMLTFAGNLADIDTDAIMNNNLR